MISKQLVCGGSKGGGSGGPPDPHAATHALGGSDPLGTTTVTTLASLGLADTDFSSTDADGNIAKILGKLRTGDRGFFWVNSGGGDVNLHASMALWLGNTSSSFRLDISKADYTSVPSPIRVYPNESGGRPTIYAATYDNALSPAINLSNTLPINTSGYFNIDPENGNDATARPTTSATNYATAFKTFAGAIAYAHTVYNILSAALYFTLKGGTTTNEAFSLARRPSGYYERIVVQGESAANRGTISASSVEAISLRYFGHAYIIRNLNISATNSTGIFTVSGPIVSINDCRIGNCNKCIDAHTSKIVIGANTVLYGANVSGISTQLDASVYIGTGLSFEAGTSFSTSCLAPAHGGKILVAADASGAIPEGKRWSGYGEVIFAGSQNIKTFGTLPGTSTGIGKVHTHTTPERRVITGNITFYVNAATGDDDVAYWMGGLPAYPFKSIQAAADYVRMLNIDGQTNYSWNISVAAGTYGPLSLRSQPAFTYRQSIADTGGNYGVRITGAGPDTVIDGGTGNCVSVDGNCRWTLMDMKFLSSGTVFAVTGGGALLALRGVNYVSSPPGGSVLDMVSVGGGGTVDFAGSVISDCACSNTLFIVKTCGNLTGYAPSFDLSGVAFALSAAFKIRSGGRVCFRATTADLFKNAQNITGLKYQFEGIGDLDTGGRAAFIPGDLAGVDNTGGLGRVW